jgi:hypothetical protein
MRIRRPTIVIPIVLALGVALAALAGSEISTAARHAPRTHVEVVETNPNVMFHG